MNQISNMGATPIEPFLRWAGGKSKLVNHLLGYLPDDINERVYREPFVGAGSLFFALQPRMAFLSDANEHLIKCYQYTRDDPDLVYTYLRRHAANTGEDYYYKMRSLYNRASLSAAQAARFIYLNKTCFNGIFRVNTKGQFNVPYGWKEPPALPSREHLLSASDALHNADLAALHFEDALENVSSSDFIYLDPPYPPLNGTSFFTHYTAERFSERDQVQLADLVLNLDSSGCKFIMSNADMPLIRKLYDRFNLFELSVVRWVTSNSNKHRVSELVITNYDLASNTL